MISTQYNLDQLAGRIERAYHRRHPNWVETGLTPGVWTAATLRLLEVAATRSSIPIDPELFVAVQSYKTFRRDPWCELTQEGASKTYQKAIRQIVRHLKKELSAELRWATRYLEATDSLDQLVAHPKSKASPIIKLMLCRQHDRADLAALVRNAADAQHLACPLYQSACQKLMPHEFYPRPKLVLSSISANPDHSHIWN